MTRGRFHLLCTLCAGLLVGPPLALAQLGSQPPRIGLPTGGLELRTVLEKIHQSSDTDGEPKTELVPVAAPVSGDEVVYTVIFTNASAEMVENIRITNPIAPEMRYVAGSAFAPGSEVLYSVDGGRTYGLPSELFVVVDGTRRAAEAADYSHIRWVMRAPLDAGAKGSARFRAVMR